MTTLAQMRSSLLQKLKKKRKLKLCSLVVNSGSKLLRKKESNKGHLNGSSKKRNRCEGFQGSRSFCSKSKDKRDDGGLQSQHLKRRKRRKGKKDKVVTDQASQLQRRTRYLILKLKSEQNLIDAYSGEGWKGQSREKIKPEKELQRAKKEILKCKLGIRDTIRQLDLLGSVGQIDNSLIAPDGSVHHEHIFCKKCQSQEVSEDNDIILCDGTCNCAFHQKCIDPPLATEDIPPEDEGWLCKYCDCKMEILDAVNAHLGTHFSADSPWQDIFKQEALLSENATGDFIPEEEWPDDESDDNDYDPNSSSRSSTENSDESSSSSLCCSLESEVYSESGFTAENNGISSKLSLLHPDCATDINEDDIVSGPRQRSTVDYRKLYDEMFGKDSSAVELCSEDEEWGLPRKKRRKKECEAATTLMTLYGSEVKQSDLQLEESKKNLSNTKARRPLSRIPSDAVQKLRLAFAENELPSCSVKRKISDLVGLEYEKVNKWFKNARYMALKNRKGLKRASRSSPSKNCDPATDETADISISKCSSPPISTQNKKQRKRVCLDSNLMILTSPLKKCQVKKASLGDAKANVEPSDDMSLKKHLLLLKAKTRQRRPRCNTEHRQAESAERQIEQLCRLEAKLWKLKLTLSAIQKPKTKKSNEPCLNEYVVYVPIAELKEKL